MGDFNDPFDNNIQQPDNTDSDQQQQSDQQPSQDNQPQYQQPQYSGQSQYQQPNQQYQQPNQQYQQPNQQYQQPNQQYQQPNQQYQQPNQQYQQPYQQYQQMGYNQFEQQPQKKFSGLALASLICGGASFLFSCCLFYVTWLSSIVGIILGILCLVGNKKKGIDNQNDKVMSIIGIILSAISLLLAITLIAVVVISGDSFMNFTSSRTITSY